MTLSEYERLARQYLAEEAAERVDITHSGGVFMKGVRLAKLRRPPKRVSPSAEAADLKSKQEREWLAVLASSRGQHLVSRIPSVADAQTAVRRFVSARVRSRSLVLDYSAPRFTGTHVVLDQDFRRSRKDRGDAPYRFHVQFSVTVRIGRGEEVEETSVYVEHARGRSWQCRSGGSLSARVFEREMERKREHTVLLKVKDRASAEDAVRRLHGLAINGCVWDFVGWSAQRQIAFFGAIRSYAPEQRPPVRRFGRTARAEPGCEDITQPISELLEDEEVTGRRPDDVTHSKRPHAKHSAKTRVRP